jgi:UDP-glucose 4-epimerase
MAVCLVTGGAGFIGSHLVEALLARGHGVRVLDNLSTGSLANLEQVADRIELVKADVADLQVVRAAMQGVELVFHQAAQAPGPRGVSDPLTTHHTCATGTLTVLLAAREAGVRRVIYAASACVYGNESASPWSEDDPTRPPSPFAVAKLAGEHYCEVFSQVFGLETVRLRYFSVFGPRQPSHSPEATVIPAFLQAFLAGRSPVICGDRLQAHDFTFVEDVVQANLLAAEAGRVSGKVYNIAFGRRTTLLELIDWLNELFGSHLKPVYDGLRPGDMRHGVADTSLAQRELGFCPWTDLKEGLRKCVADLVVGRADGSPAEGLTNGPPGKPHCKPARANHAPLQADH